MMISRVHPRLVVLLGFSSGIWMLAQADPAWARNFGMDFWNLDALRSHLLNTTKEHQRLQARGEELHARFGMNQLMLEELIAGRRTLLDVSQQMWDENQANFGYMQIIQDRYPGSTLKERVAHNIIDRITCTLNEQPVLQKKVLARLHSEYHLAFNTPFVSYKLSLERTKGFRINSNIYN